MQSEADASKRSSDGSAANTEVIIGTADQAHDSATSHEKEPIEPQSSGEQPPVPPGDPPTISDTETKGAESSEHSATLEKVTDKIRGQSMSLPADVAQLDADITASEPVTHPSHSGSDGDSSDKENSRKRKLSSRSSVATETAARQHMKRPKESDVPEREEDTEDDAAAVAPIPRSPSKPTQVFGFGAFASAKSPFVSAQNSTPSTGNSSPKPESHAAPVPSVAPTNSAVADSEVPDTSSKVQPPPTPKRGFGGFSSFAGSSPFQNTAAPAQPTAGVNPTSPQRSSLAGPVRRSKSPVGKHQAFGQYSAGISRFGTPTIRKFAQGESSAQSNDGAQAETGAHREFEDILKAKGEETSSLDEAASKPDIHQVHYNTGEEDDLTVFQTRAKLYTQDENFAYKERGTGLLKVNVRRRDGEGARIVMRAEGVLRLLLNMALYPGLICELGPDPKFVKVAEITQNERRLHAIKVGSAKLAQELYDHLSDNIPTKSYTPPV